jgi:hypothetical protein
MEKHENFLYSAIKITDPTEQITKYKDLIHSVVHRATGP